jgi:hypothetical protein
MSVDVPPTLTLPRTRTRRPLAPRFLPAPTGAPSRLDQLLTRALTSQAIWLSPVLVLQAAMCLRLRDRLTGSESLYLRTGHQLIAHLLHGTPIDAGRVSGVTTWYAVPPAALQTLGGTWLVHAVGTMLILLATVFLYLASRRLFGHGAALIAAAVFASSPATVVAARAINFDAPCLLILAVALYLATRATQHVVYPVLIGGLVAVAAPESYFALVAVPGLMTVIWVAGSPRARRRRTQVIVALAGLAAVLTSLVAAATVSNQHWQGPSSNSVGDSLSANSHLAMLHACWTTIGPLAVAGAIAIVLLPRRRLFASAVLVTALTPLVIQAGLGESTSLHRNTAYCALFLGPLIGVAGMSLVRRGRWLVGRMPVALAAIVLVLSSGFGASSAAVDSWPVSATFGALVHQYVGPTSSRFLLDDSTVPASELSRVTVHHPWIDAGAPRFLTARGSDQLVNDVRDGAYSLVLYSNQGPSPGSSRAVLAALRDRYTLIATVPASAGNAHTNLSLWIGELPR